MIPSKNRMIAIALIIYITRTALGFVGFEFFISKLITLSYNPTSGNTNS